MLTTGSAFHCLLCNHAQSQDFLDNCFDYFMRKPVVVNYVRCTACGLVQQEFVPEDVSSFYDDYPVHRQKSKLYSMLRRLLVGQVYAGVSQLAGRLLDFGCGDGSFLEEPRIQKFFRIGYEPNASQANAISQRLSIPVYHDLAELKADLQDRIDVITMHFVLEHVTNLHATFATACSLLKPGGVLYITIPHINSFEAHLFGRRWHGLDPPRHICFPCPSHVAEFARIHGLKIDRQSPVRFPNSFAGSIASLGHRFNPVIFAAALPVGVIFSGLVPTGARRYWLSRPS